MKRPGVTERIPPRDGAFDSFFHSKDLPDAIAGIRHRRDTVQPAPAAPGAPPIYVVMPGPSTPKNTDRTRLHAMPPFHPQDKKGGALYPTIDTWLTTCQLAAPTALKWDNLRAKLRDCDVIGLTLDYIARIPKDTLKSDFDFLSPGEMMFLHDHSRLSLSKIRDEAEE